ncbi:hypothetical protein [Falsiroseomonas oryziterrae]|uniref:hypothetical protein n=1 Tax=Falsiroseomonas oryziterrae TaxID=2911368 RepID=UPI001F3A4CCF|nr:hypothetical protein [Roseomonas sp. NPKOSM-4]
MVALWLYRLFLLVAVLSVLLVGALVGTYLPTALAKGGADAVETLGWAAGVAVVAVLALAAVLLRRRGWIRLGAMVACIAAMPGLFGLAMAGVVAGAFIMNSGR